MIQIAFAGGSDKGLKRVHNEDAFICDAEFGFAALADGMGGAAAGEIASDHFVDAASKVFGAPGATLEAHVVSRIQAAYARACQSILDHVGEHPEHSGMGCTGELLAFYESNFALGHVGDSRTYLFRKGSLRQLTRDHSLVQSQLDQGIISLEEAKNHSQRHVIMKAVGISANVEVDLIKGEAIAGDIFLLCSDGLTDMVDDDVIATVLALPITLTLKVERLIAQANSAGGNDNITAVLGEVL